MAHIRSNPDLLHRTQRRYRAAVAGLVILGGVDVVNAVWAERVPQLARQWGWGLTVVFLVAATCMHHMLRGLTPARAWATLTVGGVIGGVGLFLDGTSVWGEPGDLEGWWRAMYLYPAVGLMTAGLLMLMVLPAWQAAMDLVGRAGLCVSCGGRAPSDS